MEPRMRWDQHIKEEQKNHDVFLIRFLIFRALVGLGFVLFLYSLPAICKYLAQ